MMKKILYSMIPLLVCLMPFSGHAEQVDFFKSALMPVLEDKCIGCHGKKKQKSKLRLDSYAAIVKGGENEGEDTVIPGSLDSWLWGCLNAPLEDDEHMPPEAKPQMTKIEKEIIKIWIEQGAKEKHLMDAMPTNIAAYLKKRSEREDPAVLKARLAKVRILIDAAMTKVPDTGASIMPLSQMDAELELNCTNAAKTFGDDQLAQVIPVANWLCWVNLSRSQVSDAGLVALKSMPKLERLHLDNTQITDAGMDSISQLKTLKYLNLYGTKVSDAGVMKLASLDKLEKVYLWQTQVTPEGAKKLQEKLPNTQINVGWQEPPKPEPVKPEPAAAKPEPAKPAAAKPELAKPEPAKPEAALKK